jgi:hypothetical protein
VKRLRHPIRAIREPFGAAGLIIAMVALVAALGGSALAASGALTGKQKKEVEKIAKKYAGKPGAPGAAGTNGTNGTNGKDGSNGSKGDKGDPGTNGTNGTNGVDGESVTASVVPPGAGEPTCEEEGGAIYEVGGQETTICNGKEGSPWTDGGTLPVGGTETGTWAFNGSGEVKFTAEVGGTPEEITVGDEHAFVSISFPIQLAAGLSATECSTVPKPSTCQVHYQTEAEFNAFCPGTSGAPAAASGNLCVYEGNLATGSLVNATFKSINKVGSENAGGEGANKVGALLIFELTGPNARGNGTWAVTG